MRTHNDLIIQSFEIIQASRKLTLLSPFLIESTKSKLLQGWETGGKEKNKTKNKALKEEQANYFHSEVSLSSSPK